MGVVAWCASTKSGRKGLVHCITATSERVTHQDRFKDGSSEGHELNKKLVMIRIHWALLKWKRARCRLVVKDFPITPATLFPSRLHLLVDMTRTRLMGAGCQSWCVAASAPKPDKCWGSEHAYKTKCWAFNNLMLVGFQGLMECAYEWAGEQHPANITISLIFIHKTHAYLFQPWLPTWENFKTSLQGFSFYRKIREKSQQKDKHE